MPNTRVLKKGSAGTDVELWQYFLIGQGFDPGPADGSFSDDTVTATKAFQLTHGLLADGIVGRATYGVAFALGFALEDEEPHGPGWPALPPFPPLGDGAREGLFGRFAYVAAPVPSNRERIRITDDWESRNLVRVELPVGKKSFHRLGAAQLAALWDEWESAGLLDRVLSFDGSFNARFKRGSTTQLSNHAFGTAFDLNAPWNGYGSEPARTGRRGCVRELVEIAHKHGFYWGGHFSKPDGMHFEIARLKGASPFEAFIPAFTPGSTPVESGSAFIQRTAALSEREREAAILQSLLVGGDPVALRSFVPLTLSGTLDDRSVSIELRVAPDYLSIGADDDFVRVPMYPETAQRIADARNCVLPTTRLVDAIYRAATVKVSPSPMPDGRRGSNAYYLEHQRRVEAKRQGHALGALTAGHKKDIVITPRLRGHRDRVAIYGWHESEHDVIQPLSLVHSARYVDYSHGVRLIDRAVAVDGQTVDISEVLRDPKLSALVSDEGPIANPRYAT